MIDIKKVLVGLDFSPLDKQLISYAAFIGDLLGIEKVYFIHISKSLDLPAYLKNEYPELKNPKDEILKADMIKEVEKHFNPSSKIETIFEVKEGNAGEKILKWANIKIVDLVLMGIKSKLKGAGILPGKMIKLMPCSVLLIPENSTHKIEDILVPIDFSNSSKIATEMASIISNKTNAKVTYQHTFEVPMGYHSTGKSYSEFAKIMRKNAEKDFNKFKKSFSNGTDTDCIFTLNKHSNPAEIASKIALKKKSDLIIIASRGRTTMASILVGSVAEKLSHYSKSIPQMVVKNKHENMNFFKALLKL